MSLSIKTIAVIAGATAILGAVGVDVAQAATYPKDGTYHVGGSGATITPSPDPTTLATASFAPVYKAQPGCGTVAFGGGCG